MNETPLSKANAFAKQITDKVHIPHIRYSKPDYFCEGQQSHSTKEDDNERENKTAFNNNEQDRFFGHYNMFF
jgi:hypothetical protein